MDERAPAPYVNVPLAISRMSAGLGGTESLHVASRTICSISV
jgi:methylmalonyl-CoA mutase N-terminal domain/subunit